MRLHKSHPICLECDKASDEIIWLGKDSTYPFCFDCLDKALELYDTYGAGSGNSTAGWNQSQPPNKNVIEELQKALKRLKCSQRALADKLQIAPSTLSHIITGKYTATGTLKEKILKINAKV